MSNRLRSKEAATLSAILALALGATACGGGGSTSNETSTQPPAKQNNGVTFTYNKDGSVIVDPSGDFDELKEFCQGDMLVTETFTTGYYGSSVDTQPDSPYCTDGKLTPSDFQADPSK